MPSISSCCITLIQLRSPHFTKLLSVHLSSLVTQCSIQLRVLHSNSVCGCCSCILSLYFQLQLLITTGELPCSKEEAATLAGIQLHLEEAWPEEDMAETQAPDETEPDPTLQEHDHLLKVSYDR